MKASVSKGSASAAAGSTAPEKSAMAAGFPLLLPEDGTASAFHGYITTASG